MFLLKLQDPFIIFAYIAGIVIALSVHEYAHALMAYYFGDNTAYDEGRLTLNPLSHLDPIGSLLFLFVGFGWGRPVPINPLNFKNQKLGSVCVALAGPFSNLIMALFAVVLFIFGSGFIDPSSLLYFFLIYFFYINMALMLFNLIPVFPLDGSHVLFAILPDRFDYIKRFLMIWGPHILFIGVILSSSNSVSLFSWIGVVASSFGRYLGLPV